MTRFLDIPRPFGIAHRGSGVGVTEDTFPGVQSAIDLGFQCVEIDARLTSDGQVVVWHDPNLVRLLGRDVAIDEMTLEQIRVIELAGGERIRTLEEFFVRFPELTFLLDVKRDECIEPVARIIADLDAADRVCIHGSNTDGPEDTWRVSGDRMRRLRDLLGASVPGTISHSSILAVAETGQLPEQESGRYAVLSSNYDHLNWKTPDFIATMHAAGVQVIATDHGDPAVLDTLISIGVDALLTDLPAMVSDRLRTQEQRDQHTTAETVESGSAHV
ncbi:glycerophosphodiester phosphodiesterase [Nocardia sp. NPDC004711]